MKKRYMAAALAAIMACTTLSACDLSAVTEAGSTSEAQMPEAVAEEGPADETKTVSEALAAWEGDIDEINVLLADQRGNGESIKSIEEAMNAITEKTIGVHANIQLASFGDYNTQFGLMISGGESLDIASLLWQATGFSTLVANEQLYDITDLLNEYAPELMDMMGEYIVANSVNGRILGVPPYRNYASANYFYMRTDILEELGLLEEAKTIDSFSAMDEVFREVQEKTSLAPIAT